MSKSSPTERRFVHCPVCGDDAVSLTSEGCCQKCEAVLHWFRRRVELAGYRPASAISLTSSFAGDLAVDSLDLIEIICDLENDFDVSLSGNDALNIVSVGDAIGAVRRFSAETPSLPGEGSAPRHALLVAPTGLKARLSKLVSRIRKPR